MQSFAIHMDVKGTTVGEIHSVEAEGDVVIVGLLNWRTKETTPIKMRENTQIAVAAETRWWLQT
jgi:hypothetical protein